MFIPSGEPFTIFIPPLLSLPSAACSFTSGLYPRTREVGREKESALGTIREMADHKQPDEEYTGPWYLSSKGFAFFVCTATLILVISFW